MANDKKNQKQYKTETRNDDKKMDFDSSGDIGFSIGNGMTMDTDGDIGFSIGGGLTIDSSGDIGFKF